MKKQKTDTAMTDSQVALYVIGTGRKLDQKQRHIFMREVQGLIKKHSPK